MNTKQIRVLVTGARAPVTLHLCRILSQDGRVVFAADSVPYALAKSSKYINGFFKYPSPKFETKKWVKSLIRFIKDNKIDLVIPTCEETFYLSMFKNELSQYCDLFVDDFEKMKILHHKEKFIKFVEKLKLITPKTYLLTSKLDKEELEHLFISKELVIKKAYSRFSNDVIFLPSAKDLPHDLELNSSWVVQEKISGMQYCSYGIARNGKLIAHSVYRSEFTAGLGATLTFKYTKNDEIEHFVRTVVKQLAYTGQISFDFIMNQEGVPIPIECNPRATSGLHLFNNAVGACFTGNFQKSTLYPNMDVKEAIKLGVLFYGGTKITSLKKLKRWLQILITYRDITYRRDDVYPYFYQFISMYYLWKDSKKNKNNLVQQSTYDINWDGD